MLKLLIIIEEKTERVYRKSFLPYKSSKQLLIRVSESRIVNAKIAFIYLRIYSLSKIERLPLMSLERLFEREHSLTSR